MSGGYHVRDGLIGNLKQASEITFKYLTEPDRQLLVACKPYKNGTFSSIRYPIILTETETDTPQLTENCALVLNEKLPDLVRRHCTGRLKQIKICGVDDRLPDFVNKLLASLLNSSSIALKKITFDNCAFDLRHTPPELPNSIFDPTLLKSFLQSGKTQELYIDLEDLLYTTEADDADGDDSTWAPHAAGVPPMVQSAASCADLVSALSERPSRSSSSLKVLSLSWTPQLEMHQLVNIIQAQTDLQELVLYNAFNECQKTALLPFIDAIKAHPALQKLTFLHSRMDSATYKWAIYSVLEGNRNITSLCTDGFYNENATWLARLLRSNTQLTTVNLSHPEFDSDQYRRSGDYSSALSLIRGIESASSRLVKVNLMGLDLGKEGAQSLRTILQDPKSAIQSLVCGSMTTTPSNFALVVGGLIVNTTVRKFAIRSLNLDSIGAQTVADVIRSNSSLESLILGASQRRYRLRRHRTTGTQQMVGPLSATIASALAENSSLKALVLPTNMNDADCIQHFQTCLHESNRTLESLQFWPRIPCENDSIVHWTRLNQCGRSTLLQSGIPDALWAHVFERVELDTVRYYVQEVPDLISQGLRTLRTAKRRQIEGGVASICTSKKTKTSANDAKVP